MSTYLVTKQLVDDTQYLLGQQRPVDVVVLVERLSWGKAAAVHLGIHDLESHRLCETRSGNVPIAEETAYLKTTNSLKECEEAIFN